MADHPKPDELPGGELPRAVYESVVGAFVWMLLAAWIAFGTAREADFTLAFATLLFLIFFAILAFISVTARRHMAAQEETLAHFLHSEVDTATGPLTGRAAWIEIAVIPVALALAATLIGMVYAFTR
jgi:type IV secretory pathway VirB2 component (pilin)